jgi:hypothetical protein
MALTDIDGLRNELAPIFEAMRWAEEEIEAAQRRHPAAADRSGTPSACSGQQRS